MENTRAKRIKDDLAILVDLSSGMAEKFHIQSEKILDIASRLGDLPDDEYLGLDLAAPECLKLYVDLDRPMFFAPVNNLETLVNRKLRGRGEALLQSTFRYRDIETLMPALVLLKDEMQHDEAQQVLDQGYCDLEVFEQIENKYDAGKDLSSEDHQFLVNLVGKYGLKDQD